MARLLTASLISAVAGVGSLAFGFASSVIIARSLGAHGTGLVSFAIWLGTTLSTVAGFGIQNVVLRYMKSNSDSSQQGGGLARALLRPFNFGILAATTGMLLWAGWQGIKADYEMMQLWIATAIFYLIFAYASLSLSAARGVDDYSSSARRIFYGCLMQVPFVLVGAWLFGAAGALLGQMVRHLPTALSLKTYLGSSRPTADVVTPAMKIFGRNTWLSGMIGILIWTRIEFVFLGLSHTAAEIGFFAVGMTLAGLVVQLPEQMSAALLPFFGRHHDNNDLGQLRRSYQRVFRWIGLLMLPICFGGAVIMPELLPLLFGEAFLPAVPSAVILVGTSWITAFTIIPSAMIAARERGDFFLRISIAMAIFIVALLAIVVPTGGAVGAAVVRAIAHTGWLVALSWYCQSLLRMPPPILDLLKVAASALICAIAAFLVLEVQTGSLGLILAVVAGGVVYLVCLRLTAAIPHEDVEVLSIDIGSALPARLGWLARTVLLMIAPHQQRGGEA